MKKIISAIIMTTALSGFGGLETAMAQSKPANPPVSGSISTTIVNKNILISGKQQGNEPMISVAGNVDIGKFGAFGQVNKDSEAVREVDTGLYFKTKISDGKLGKLSMKLAAERKAFPDQKKEMYLLDLGLTANTKIGEYGILYRTRLHTANYERGSTIAAICATPQLKLGTIAGIKTTAKGTFTIAYQEKFVGTNNDWAYATPGISITASSRKFTLEGFLKRQIPLRYELQEYTVIGAKLACKF